MSDLEAILKGKAPEVIQEDVQVESSPEPKQENQEVIPEAKGVKAEEEKGEPPSSETKTEQEPESWTKTAAIDERRKRQELEKKYQQLEAELAALRQPAQPKQEVERPNVFDDPENAFNYSENLVEQKAFARLVKYSEAEMREKHSDYDEMSDEFMKLAQQNPVLKQELFNAPNPAKFAYNTAKNYLEAQKFSDPTYKEQLKEDIRKEVLAELARNQEVSKPVKLSVQVPDLSKTTSALSGDKFPEEKTLEDLLPNYSKRKKRG